ncbi:DUF885 domain-containing protein [Aquimarina agarilytica]|uniref:DUF885 domain-containing protein n=1 Tax=Aquimarina agarilytica TaxID=1087449 RepID=UPI000289DD73|nr:DUF885 domain-containing protein [Aquimarina agarilytica]
MKTSSSISLVSVVFLLSFFSCKNNTNSPETIEPEITQEQITQTSASLNNWFQKQFEIEKELSPMLSTYLGEKKNNDKWDDISQKAQDEALLRNKKRLQYLKDSVNTAALNKTTLLSYNLALQQTENEISDDKYRLHDYPVNQMFGTHSEVPSFLINMHLIDSKKDAEAYISRLKGVKKLFDQLVTELQLREKAGILPPKFIFPKVIDACQNITKGKPFDTSNKQSTLLADFSNKIKGLELSENEKNTLIDDAKKSLLSSVKPAYENLITVLKSQESKATTDAGVWKLPNGNAFFDNALARTTTTNMTANEIHELGLKEVARIQGEMKAIKEKVKFKGDLTSFFKFMQDSKQFYYADSDKGREQYMEKAVHIIDSMKSRLDELFLTKPKADIKVKQVEPFREKTAGLAFYQQPAMDGSRPGIYYANMYKIKSMSKFEMEALAYHEGIPGHHMQIAIAQELKDIPMFRKLGGYTAYVEGWGLYSEYIPKEMGFYNDPYSDFGRLSMELFRACRLVVDTGIHAKKWTREQGIKYYKDNTPTEEFDIIKMVERHIVMPSQATAYKIGMNKILELRENAKKQLGDKFDIREYHDVVLTNGAVPLNVLEKLVDDWIASKA